MDINFVSPINKLGFGYSGLNIFKALSRENRVALWIIGQAEANPKDHDIIKRGLQNALTFNNKAVSLRLWHQFDMSQHVGKGLHAGFPIFELNKFNKVELHHLRSLDHIFVPSQWAKNIIYNNGISNPCTVAPLGVDTSIFYPHKQEVRTDNVVRFLNIGKWEIRKGHDILIEAFNKAFEPQDKVELIMNCHNPFLGDGNQQWESMYKKSRLGDKVTILPNRLESQEDVAALMNSVDCGVFPARSEGWNLELLEMMACGKNVIATNYAGHTEFIQHSNVFTIEINQLENAYDGKWFHGDGEWAALEENQINQLIMHMRNIYRWHHQHKNNISLETAKCFTWDNTANKILGVLSEKGRS